jgi:transposase
LLDVVGLYLNPPDHALVLCVDEKPGIQALDRTQPLLPLRAKKPRSWTNEYVRHGTQTLLAALEIASGKVQAQVKLRRTSVNFLRFMDQVAAAYPLWDLHVVLDNLNIHKNEAAQKWLQRHPRVYFHYIPTHASWLNLIECFYSILTRQGLSQSVHRSTRQLKDFLLEYIAHYNQHCTPFVWTKGPDKLQRIIEATQQYQTTYPPKPRKRRKRYDNKNN